MPDISKRLLVPALALFVGLALASCASDEPAAGQSAAADGSASPSSASDIKTYSIGDSVTVPMSAGNVAAVTIIGVDHPETLEGMNKSVVTPESGRFVRLDVSWKTEEGVTDAHSTQLALRDPEGSYAKPHGLITDTGTLWVDGVAAGDEVRGYVTFEAEEGPQTILLKDANWEDLAHIELPE